ncbi:DNA polymerase IV [Candidatus Peregrinibacteria bacterium]|nr:DNA polymerase IV [Candidatus Peregrinibacteria bacterium]
MFAHIDADAFFASALQRRRPDLKGKPLLALGMGGGCVIAASYEAKAFGVKTGMRLSEAKKLCPKAIAIPSDFEEALLASRQIETILGNRCPLIEQYSIDEWFLDLRTLPGGTPANLEHYLRELQKTVGASVGLTISIGAGPSKLLAKMASEYRKPAGVTIISPPVLSIDDFLRDRTAATIPGIGPRRQLLSTAHGWTTAYDIAHADSVLIKKLLGEPGVDMQRELLGEALTGINENPAPPKSVSRCRSFPSSKDREMVYGHLLHHLTYTMLKMRREGLACRMVSVWMRDHEYRHRGYTMKLPLPVDTEEQALPYIEKCFARLWENGLRCTQTGLALLDLNPKGGTQFSLFEAPKKTEGAEKVQTALDVLHSKYGRGVIGRGAAMNTAGAGKKKLSVAEAI